MDAALEQRLVIDELGKVMASKMSYFAQGFEKELCSFINTKDLDIRASVEKSKAMEDIMTKASSRAELCKQHGLEIEQGAIVIHLQPRVASCIASAALEAEGLHLQDNTVMCAIPVLFKFPPVTFGMRGPA
jgi:hypothetical protein